MKRQITITKLVVGQMAENCYLVANDLTQEVCIIDPGDDGEYLVQNITAKNLQPVAVLLTHGHFDHCMAAFEVQQIYGVPCFISDKDEFLLDRIADTAKHFLQHEVMTLRPICTHLDCTQKVFNIGSFSFELLLLPGHTPGSVGYYLPDERMLFSGDVVFNEGGVGRTDFSYASPLKLAESLDVIRSLPSITTINPGHGDTFQLEMWINQSSV